MHPLKRAARAALLLALATQGACWPGAADYPESAPALYTQYVVRNPADAASNACFYGCLRSLDMAERTSCLEECKGVALSVTADPCSPAIRVPCTYNYDGLGSPAPAPTADEDDDSGGGGLLGGIVQGLLGAAFSHHDDGESKRASSDAESRGKRRAEVASRAPNAEQRAPVQRRIAVPRPEPPERHYRVAQPEHPAKK